MAAPDRKRCPTCGSLNAVLAVERFGVRTFYCTDCEYDWDEHVDDEPAPPRAPSPH
jgi:transposase-like protein